MRRPVPLVGATYALRYASRTFGCGLLLAVAACDDEFPTDPRVVVTADPTVRWNLTTMVQDTDTVVVRLKDPDDHVVSGVGVRWESSDPTLLELKAIRPQGESRRDSLEAQLHMQAISHARGTAVVRAFIDQTGVAPLVVEDTVTILERWVAVGAGAGYTCGLTINRNAYCWGGLPTAVFYQNNIVFDPRFGLGNGSAAGSTRPVSVLGGQRFSTLATGDFQTCGLTLETGLLYCWGDNTWGQLGSGNFEPALIPTLTLGARTFTQVSTNGGTTCAISNAPVRLPNFEGEANTFCWGRASFGALGTGRGGPDSSPPPPVELCSGSRIIADAGAGCIPKPSGPVGFNPPAGFLALRISVGAEFACAMREKFGILLEGEVYCWGINAAGQAGPIPSFPDSPRDCSDGSSPVTPIQCSAFATKLGGGLQFTALSSGGGHSCGVANRSAYCWGERYGPSPVKVSGTLQLDSVGISVGGGDIAGVSAQPGFTLSHSCALTAQGEAYCWGDNTGGELGTGELPEAQNPPIVIHHDDLQQVSQDTLVFVAISAGKRFQVIAGPTIAHTCALTRDGAIYCWGDNLTGALGVPGLDRVAIPTRIAEPGP